MAVKRRTLPFNFGSVRDHLIEVRYIPLPVREITNVKSLVGLGTRLGSQETDSQNNHWKGARKAGDLSDVGGPFFTRKQYIIAYPVNIQDTRVSGSIASTVATRTLTGPAYAIDARNAASYPFPPALSSSTAQLDQLGAEAVSHSLPTNALADLATFLGELRQFPKLPFETWKATTQRGRELQRLNKPQHTPSYGKRGNTLRDTGDEYLNMVFGWKPMLSDLEKFGNALKESSQRMGQLERDSGKVVRRRLQLPSRNEVLSNTLVSSSAVPLGPTGTGVLKSPLVSPIWRERRITQRRWFSGAFTYHVPADFDTGGGLKGLASKADDMFSLTLTPEVIWNLAPWSWAADWFSNTDAVIHNLQHWSKFSYVMRYGYLMEHTIVTDTYSRQVSPYIRGHGVGDVTLITETKVRRKANPFGFGVSWSGLSPQQLAIVAALGLSRS